MSVSVVSGAGNGISMVPSALIYAVTLCWQQRRMARLGSNLTGTRQHVSIVALLGNEHY